MFMYQCLYDCIHNMYTASVCVMCFLQAFCEPGNVEENGVLAFAKHVLFPVLDGKGFHCLHRV